MRGYIPIISVLLLLAGCGFTPEGDALRRAVAGTGAKAADNALVNVEWYMCEAASVGSIKRRYGATADLAEAYSRLCDRGSSAEIVAPGR